MTSEGTDKPALSLSVARLDNCIIIFIFNNKQTVHIYIPSLENIVDQDQLASDIMMNIKKKNLLKGLGTVQTQTSKHSEEDLRC